MEEGDEIQMARLINADQVMKRIQKTEWTPDGGIDVNVMVDIIDKSLVEMGDEIENRLEKIYELANIEGYLLNTPPDQRIADEWVLDYLNEIIESERKQLLELLTEGNDE